MPKKYDPNVTPISQILQGGIGLRPGKLEQFGRAALGRTYDIVSGISDFQTETLKAGLVSDYIRSFLSGKPVETETQLRKAGRQKLGQKLEDLSSLPGPITPGENIAQFAGNLAPDLALGIATAPVSIGVGAGLRAGGAGMFKSVLAGEAAQSGLLAPVEFLSRPPAEAAAVTLAAPAFGTGLYYGFKGLGSLLFREATEKVGKNLLENKLPSADVDQRALKELGLREDVIDTLDVLNTSTPAQIMLPEISKTVAEGNTEILKAHAQQVARNSSTIDEISVRESNADLAEVLTADGPISTKAAMYDAVNKKMGDAGLRTFKSILDEVRPGATLAERKYVLLNGDTKVFQEVSERFKTPLKTIGKLIDKAKKLPEDQRGQFLFKSLEDQAHIARLRGDVDVFQVPKYNPEFERFRQLKIDQDELNGHFFSDDELRNISSAVSFEDLDPVTQMWLGGSSLGKRVFDAIQQSYEVSEEGLAGTRRLNLDTIAYALREGSPDVADLILQSHVSQKSLQLLADNVRTSLINIGEIGSTASKVLTNWRLRNIKVLGSAWDMESLRRLGLARHFPENRKTSATALKGREGVLVPMIKETEDLRYVLAHEYAHGISDFIRNLAEGANVAAKEKFPEFNLSPLDIGEFAGLDRALDNAAKLQGFRLWDPVAESIAKLSGTKWPEPSKRIGLPPNYDSAHSQIINERRADLFALLSTKEGHRWINPEARAALEPYFGKIQEPYAPGNIQQLERTKFNTTKTAGKAMVSVTDEARIKLDAISSMTSPETGNIPRGAQEVLNNVGPVAAHAMAKSVDSGGPFTKPRMLDNIPGVGNKLELRDFLFGLRQLRASMSVSGMSTFYANALTTLLRSAIEAPLTVAAAAADATKVGLGLQKSREVFFGESAAVLKGQIESLAETFGFESAMPNALRAFAKEVRGSKEIVSSALTEKGNYLNKLVTNIPNKALQQAGDFVVSRFVQTPFYVLKATDDFFFDKDFAGAMYRLAYRNSVKEDKSFSAAMADIGEKLKKYDLEAKAIVNQAEQFARSRLTPIKSAENLTETKVFGKNSEIAIHGWEAGKFTEQLTMLGKESEPVQLQPSLFGDNPHAVEFLGENKEEILNLSRQFLMKNIPGDISEAKLTAERAIFVARENKGLDKFLDFLDRADHSLGGIVSIPLMFRRTPANIVREGLRTSPLGFLPVLAQALGKNPEVAMTPRESSLLLGQAMLGTGLFYSVWLGIQTGKIKGDSGVFNPNKAQRDTYTAQGRKPASIEVRMFDKDYLIPLDRLQPFGGMISAMLEHNENIKRSEAQEVDQESIATQGAAIAWSLTRELGVGDFARNVGDFLDAINSSAEIGREKAAKRYLGQLGASFVPSFVRQTYKGIGNNPAVQEESGYLLAPYKGAKASLSIGPDKIGLFGDTSYKGVKGVAGILSGGSIGVKQDDFVVNKMVEVGAFHQAPKVSDEVKTLPQKQQVAFQVGKGRLQRQFVERVVLNPGFAGLHQDAQKRLIDKAFNRASALADKRAKAIIKLRGILNEDAIFKGRM